MLLHEKLKRMWQSLCAPEGKKKNKKIRARLTQVFSSTSSIFPQSDLFTSALSYFTSPLHLCSISSFSTFVLLFSSPPTNNQNQIWWKCFTSSNGSLHLLTSESRFLLFNHFFFISLHLRHFQCSLLPHRVPDLCLIYLVLLVCRQIKRGNWF